MPPSGKTLTAAEKLDMADGKLDGKYFGKKIHTVPNSHTTHHTHNTHHHGRRGSHTSHHSDGEQRGANGKRLTAAEKLDMQDGVMDGKYYGKKIMSVKSEHRVHRKHARREEAESPPPPPPTRQPPQQPPQPPPRERRRRPRGPRQMITEERYEPVDIPVIVEERVEHFMTEPVIYHVEKKVQLPPRTIYLKEIDIVPDPPQPQVIVVQQPPPPPPTYVIEAPQPQPQTYVMEAPQPQTYFIEAPQPQPTYVYEQPQQPQLSTLVIESPPSSYVVETQPKTYISPSNHIVTSQPQKVLIETTTTTATALNANSMQYTGDTYVSQSYGTQYQVPQPSTYTMMETGPMGNVATRQVTHYQMSATGGTTVISSPNQYATQSYQAASPVSYIASPSTPRYTTVGGTDMVAGYPMGQMQTVQVQTPRGSVVSPGTPGTPWLQTNNSRATLVSPNHTYTSHLVPVKM